MALERETSQRYCHLRAAALVDELEEERTT